MRFKWNRLFALPNQKEFYNHTTSYFMKDDHDTLCNDSYPGMSYGTVAFERGVEIFDKEQFPSNEKSYKTILWGKDLQIWLLDSRNYRSRNSDPDGPEKTIWGKDQKKWFFNTLRKSKATFKVLISANPILGPDRDNKSDNHANDNFKFEKEEILNELNKCSNVYICNGDRHWQYVTNYNNTNLWEFCCGAGTDNHQPNAWQVAKQGVRAEHKFLRTKGGFMNVNIVKNKFGRKSISFNHHGVDGEIVNEQKFYFK
jgi:alkaline phosphatase D